MASCALYERKGAFAMALKDGHLSRMKICGYKSIKNCDVQLGHINVLIGANGAGKSNFISSFEFINSVISKNLRLSVAQRGLNSLLFMGRKVTEEIAFQVMFGDCGYGFALAPTDDNRLIFKRESFFEGGSRNDIPSQGHTESMRETGTECNANLEVLRILEGQSRRVYHFNDTGRDSKMKQEHNIVNDKALLPDASNLAAFLYRLRNNFRKHYDEIVRTVRLAAPFFSDFALEPNEMNKEQIVLKWRQAGCDDIFTVSQMSDGTLRFICLTTLLLQPKELQPATIIMDEPELGLHPYAVSIFSEMARRQEKQIIIATQSVELLNEFDVDDVIVTEHSRDGTILKRLNSAELETWLEDDYALGDLWKKNILGGRPSK